MPKEKLEVIANRIRQFVIVALANAKSGHTASSLGMADIFTYLYFSFLKVSTKDPWNKSRDRLILSAGHLAPLWYTTLAVRGFFNTKELTTLRDINGLEGHPLRHQVPGVENTSGPLGQGISFALGCAFALKETNSNVICVISDGELNEGQTWEALMKVGNSKLSNFIVIIDRNNIQISGTTNEVMPLEPLLSKIESFNLVVFEINGHSFKEIDEAFKKAQIVDKPVCIVANTIAGKGVSFIEDNYEWHGKVPTGEEAKSAILELKAIKND